MVKEYFGKFWKFLQEDSWGSFAVTLLLAFVVIKFVFFPGLSLLTGTSLPLVIVESCSMYHQEAGLERVFDNSVYGDLGISLADTLGWDFQNGFSKGDVIFVVGVDEPEVGDVIIFNGGTSHPIIHRVVEAGDEFVTKGDNNPQVYPFDRNIKRENLVGRALFKVPFIGWAKLIFYESSRRPEDRGLCS